VKEYQTNADYDHKVMFYDAILIE